MRECARGGRRQLSDTSRPPRGAVSSNALLGARLVSCAGRGMPFFAFVLCQRPNGTPSRMNRGGAEVQRDTASCAVSVCLSVTPIGSDDCESGPYAGHHPGWQREPCATAARGRVGKAVPRVGHGLTMLRRLSLHSMRLTPQLSCEGRGSHCRHGLRQLQLLVSRLVGPDRRTSAQ